MTENYSQPTIHVPEGMAYTCHSEGVCCNVFDTIPLDAPAERALSGIAASEIRASVGPTLPEPYTASTVDGVASHRVARKACGSCAMLTPGGLCAIHAIAGEAAKPRVCQDFPYRYVEAPDGVYVGLSFVCPSVRKNRGQLLSEQGAALTERYAQSASIRTTDAAIPLNGRVTLDWQDYKAFEAALLSILSMTNTPLPDRLIAVSILPGFLDQMLTQAKASSHRASALDILKAMEGAGFNHVFQVAAKSPTIAPRNRRMFLGMFASFANTLHRRNKGRLRTTANVMTQYFRHAAGLGRVTLQPLPMALTPDQLDQAVTPAHGHAARAITRYISHCIWRKDLTLNGDLTRRTRLLCLNAALISWYASAVALSEGRHFAINDDWDEAIGHVERLYGFHSAFYRFFEKNQAFSDIVDSFILKPSYPYTLFK